MKCLLPKAALSLLLTVFSASAVLSQSSFSKYEAGLSVGMLVYQGDLTPNDLGAFETQKLSVGLHGSRIISPVFAVRGNLVVGKLKADEFIYENPEFRKERAFSFTSPVVELSAQLVWNLAGSNYQDRGFLPYLFAGAGVSFLNIKRDWSRMNRDIFSHERLQGLATDSAHSLPKAIPVIPLGGGVKYFFNSNWGVNLEANYRFTRTDYLDGFSQAAEPDKKDKYLGYSIGVVYRIGGDGGSGGGGKNKLGCPKW